MTKQDLLAISIILANTLNGVECVTNSAEISEAYSVAIQDFKKA